WPIPTACEPWPGKTKATPGVMALSYEGIPSMLSTENSPVRRLQTAANSSIYDKLAAIDADHIAGHPLGLRVGQQADRRGYVPGHRQPAGWVLGLRHLNHAVGARDLSPRRGVRHRRHSGVDRAPVGPVVQRHLTD